MENQKFFVSLLLKQSRQKEGKVKLFIRITVDGKRAEIATTHFNQPSNWDNAKGRMKNSAPQAVYINGFIEHASNSIQKHFLTNVSVGNPVTAQILKDLYLGNKEKTTPKTLLDAFAYKISDQVVFICNYI